MTNELTKLITFLNEQKRVRAEASKGFVHVDDKRLFVDNAPQYWAYDMNNADASFVEAAAINYTTIIDIAIKAIEQRNSWAEAWSDRTHESNARDLISDNAELTKICEIGSGK